MYLIFMFNACSLALYPCLPAFGLLVVLGVLKCIWSLLEMSSTLPSVIVLELPNPYLSNKRAQMFPNESVSFFPLEMYKL